ncbi:MAG: PilZ domain-containing protein [Acutalibacter sp.]|jgi:hypothetical protein
MSNARYLILDVEKRPLTYGELLDPPGTEQFRIRLPADRLETVMEQATVQLIGISEGAGVLMGQVLDSRGDDVAVIRKLQSLDENLRQNLRMPVKFHTFLYPVTGTWKGRREAESRDLSCGGIGFVCGERLEEDESLEVVIPITTQPLVVPCRILRVREEENGGYFYAAKFSNLCNG